MTLPIIFSQRDPRWAAQRLGTVNGTTIGDYGCYVTTMATGAVYFGKDTDPSRLDNFFTDNKLYASGNLMYDNNLQKAFPDIVYQATFDYGNNPADLNRLKDLLSDPANFVILEVDFNPATELLDTHFVAAVSCDGSTVMIADPWPIPGAIRNLTVYGKPAITIQKMVVYKGVPSGAPDGNTITIPVAERDTLISRSTTAKEVAIYLAIDDPDHAPTDRYKKSIDGIKGTATAIQTTLTETQKKLTEANQEVLNREEQVSGLKAQALQAAEREKSLSDQLNLASANTAKAVKVVTDQLKAMTGAKNIEAAAKGTALKQVAVLTQQLDACQKGQATSTSFWKKLLALLGGGK